MPEYPTILLIRGGIADTANASHVVRLSALGDKHSSVMLSHHVVMKGSASHRVFTQLNDGVLDGRVSP